ncbi:hypothetical protein N9L76_10835, partial [bacterium]|nr:hypothetical protein [bacterium]
MRTSSVWTTASARSGYRYRNRTTFLRNPTLSTQRVCVLSFSGIETTKTKIAKTSKPTDERHFVEELFAPQKRAQYHKKATRMSYTHNNNDGCEVWQTPPVW